MKLFRFNNILICEYGFNNIKYLVHHILLQTYRHNAYQTCTCTIYVYGFYSFAWVNRLKYRYSNFSSISLTRLVICMIRKKKKTLSFSIKKLFSVFFYVIWKKKIQHFSFILQSSKLHHSNVLPHLTRIGWYEIAIRYNILRKSQWNFRYKFFFVLVLALNNISKTENYYQIFCKIVSSITKVYVHTAFSCSIIQIIFFPLFIL